MFGVAGRSGRKKFVPTPDHRDLVKLLATRRILHEHIRRLIRVSARVSAHPASTVARAEASTPGPSQLWGMAPKA